MTRFAKVAPQAVLISAITCLCFNAARLPSPERARAELARLEIEADTLAFREADAALAVAREKEGLEEARRLYREARGEGRPPLGEALGRQFESLERASAVLESLKASRAATDRRMFWFGWIGPPPGKGDPKAGR